MTPHTPSPTIRATVLVPVAVLLAASLLSFSWTTSHEPDPAALLAGVSQRRFIARHTRDQPSDEPFDQVPDRAAGSPPHDDTTIVIDEAETSDDDPQRDEVAAAQRFVEVALDGSRGEGYRDAAQYALTVATEYGFDDDPKRVAALLHVFLHPSHGE